MRQEPENLLSPLPFRAGRQCRTIVFIVGFNKTGTTSFHRLFLDNGYASIHFDRGRLARKMIQNSLEDRKLPNGYDHKIPDFFRYDRSDISYPVRSE